MKYSNKLIREILVELVNGESVSKLSRKHGISERTIRRWRDLIELIVGRHHPRDEKPKTTKKRPAAKIEKPSCLNLTIAIEIKLPLPLDDL